MKRYISLLLALLTVLCAAGCKQADTDTTEAAAEKQQVLTCAVGYPVLADNGYVTPTSGMADYPGAVTLEDVLKSGFNAGVEVTFDDEGNIASIGKLKAEGGNSFIVITIASNGMQTPLTEKPADIVLTAYATYEIIYADANGQQITILE